MKNDGFFDVDADQYLEENKDKKKAKKSDSEILDEDIYARRCKLVKLAHSDYYKFKEYLLNNESFFKSKMAQPDKECMRRTCQTAYDRSSYADYDDLQIFDRIFGRWVDPRKSDTIPITQQIVHEKNKKSVEEEIKERSCGTYYAMWDFITNPEWQEKLKGRADLYDKVKFMIDRAKDENYAVVPSMKRYEPTDEIIIEKVLEMMKNDNSD